jgi:hypothetical protein
MLQDPIKGVLVPLAPEELATVAAVPVTFTPGARYSNGAWHGLADVTLVTEDKELPLGPALAFLPTLPAPEQARHDTCFSAMIGGDPTGAGAGFASLALTGIYPAPALYGVALALEKLGAFDEAEALAAFVSELPGYNDPRAAALAGYAAFQRRQPKAARLHLARAARLARLQPEFRSVQRFAQRVLLMQQFALGD